MTFFEQQARSRRSGSTTEPQFQTEQLMLALQAYCVVLHPRFERRLAKLKEPIDRARAGTSQECDELCVRLAKAIVAFG